jgi:hypothetical protein
MLRVNKRRWRDLCEEAEAVDDLEKLQTLTEQITGILNSEQERLKKLMRRSKTRSTKRRNEFRQSYFLG